MWYKGISTRYFKLIMSMILINRYFNNLHELFFYPSTAYILLNLNPAIDKIIELTPKVNNKLNFETS